MTFLNCSRNRSLEATELKWRERQATVRFHLRVRVCKTHPGLSDLLTLRPPLSHRSLREGDKIHQRGCGKPVQVTGCIFHSNHFFYCTLIVKHSFIVSKAVFLLPHFTNMAYRLIKVVTTDFNASLHPRSIQGSQGHPHRCKYYFFPSVFSL